MAKKNVCIVGGGATGVALLWALSQDPVASKEWNVTLIHDQKSVGGHSLTYYVPVQGKNKKLPIDIGVQFISPMMYPNVHVMLQRPEFQSRVPMNDYNSLKIAAAFPRLNGKPMNWGNFPAYQQGPNFALYNSDMQFDANQFQDFIEAELFDHWSMRKLYDFFYPNPPIPFRNKTDFINYILSPYMSIINGYGSALLNDTIFMDLFPLFATLPLPESWGFPTPLGSFTKPGTGWQRFANGAQSWVEAMLEVAKLLVPSTQVILDSKVSAVWTDQSTGQVTVQWSKNGAKPILSRTFDKVILTTDMWTNSKLLNNPKNQYYWNNVYYNPKLDYPIGDYRDTNMKPSGPHVTWDLLWGMCYIHTDSTMLSPDLMQQQETLQFNAYFAPGNQNGNYNLIDTFTTYIQKNVLNDPDADGLYLTMYGYIPDPSKGQKVPDPKKVLFSEPWTHGRWTPSAMDGPKTKLYMAQGLGNIPYPGQMNTNVYFAGNNTTVDSEDGALISALAIANYAFGVNYPLEDKSLGETLFAFTMYNMYHNIMFPTLNGSHALTSLFKTLPALSRVVSASRAISRRANAFATASRGASAKKKATKKQTTKKRKPAKRKAKKTASKKKSTRKAVKPTRKTRRSKSKRR